MQGPSHTLIYANAMEDVALSPPNGNPAAAICVTDHGVASHGDGVGNQIIANSIGRTGPLGTTIGVYIVEGSSMTVLQNNVIGGTIPQPLVNLSPSTLSLSPFFPPRVPASL